jgi:hypothetical protein
MGFLIAEDGQGLSAPAFQTPRLVAKIRRRCRHGGHWREENHHDGGMLKKCGIINSSLSLIG